MVYIRIYPDTATNNTEYNREWIPGQNNGGLSSLTGTIIQGCAMAHQQSSAAVQFEAADLHRSHNQSPDVCSSKKPGAVFFSEHDYSTHQCCQLDKGHHLFQSGDGFYGCYIVRSGSVKTYITTSDGHDQITDFHFPGDLVGMDAMSGHCHLSTADALELTTVCMIPVDNLIGINGTSSNGNKSLLYALSKKIVKNKKHMLLLCNRYAESRLATFLLILSEVYRERGFSAHEFNLTMNRADIGNYIGLSTETTSRLFSRFKEQGLIRTQRKLVSILDPERLWQLGLESSNTLRATG